MFIAHWSEINKFWLLSVPVSPVAPVAPAGPIWLENGPGFPVLPGCPSVPLEPVEIFMQFFSRKWIQHYSNEISIVIL